MPADDPTPRALLAEDEVVLRQQLREQLAMLWPELVISAEVSDGVAAMRALEADTPDILFLDIQMPGLSGLDVAQQANGRCHVVFVTAYDKYAVAAFERGAVDYVMKPFDAGRLATTVTRLKQRLDSKPANLEGLLRELARTVNRDQGYLRWITASQGSSVRVITIDEICYFKADTKYTLVATRESEALISRPIKDLIEELDPNLFWQVHRGTLVNVNCIAGVGRDFRGRLSVRLKGRPETLAVSDPYVYRFKQM
jgi:DNA-binding LytR/AlgR family response regulator